MDTDQVNKALYPKMKGLARGRDTWHEELGITEEKGVCVEQCYGFVLGPVPQNRS